MRQQGDWAGLVVELFVVCAKCGTILYYNWVRQIEEIPCLTHSSRCDKELDCPDRSDERACSFVTLDSDYLEDVMPRDAELKDPVIVHINMSILAIPDIDTVKMQFKADFILSLKWHDLRVRLEHLNKVTVLNTLNNEEIKDLWKPELRFDYTFGPFNVLYDEQVSAKIIRESEPLTDDISRVKESEYHTVPL